MSDETRVNSEGANHGSEDDGVVPDEAFISPDEPIVRDSFRAALISPDEPLEEEVEGVVVGMDGSAEHEPVIFQTHLEPSQMAGVLERVAATLREDGLAGLRVRAGTPHFESVLKAYISGYCSTDS